MGCAGILLRFVHVWRQRESWLTPRLPPSSSAIALSTNARARAATFDSAGSSDNDSIRRMSREASCNDVSACCVKLATVSESLPKWPPGWPPFSECSKFPVFSLVESISFESLRGKSSLLKPPSNRGFLRFSAEERLASRAFLEMLFAHLQTLLHRHAFAVSKPLRHDVDRVGFRQFQSVVGAFGKPRANSTSGTENAKHPSCGSGFLVPDHVFLEPKNPVLTKH
jgi:hypothetical protein